MAIRMDYIQAIRFANSFNVFWIGLLHSEPSSKNLSCYFNHPMHFNSMGTNLSTVPHFIATYKINRSIPSMMVSPTTSSLRALYFKYSLNRLSFFCNLSVFQYTYIHYLTNISMFRLYSNLDFPFHGMLSTNVAWGKIVLTGRGLLIGKQTELCVL